MEVVVERCCGLDVHQKTVVACTLVGNLSTNRPKKLIKTFGTRTFELQELASWLHEQEISTVMMESTRQYWCPIWNVLEKEGFKLILANPQRIKGIPGRKTDQKDAEWIAQLGRVGLVPQSYVPPTAIQELRSLTRTRTHLIAERTQHKNRIHNILQQGNIKLTGFLSDIYGKTGRKLVDLLLSGEKIEEENILECLHSRVKASSKDIVESLKGTLTKAHRFEMQIHFDIIDCLEEQITELSKEIRIRIAPYQEIIDELIKIPGVKESCVEVILSEIGPDISAFQTQSHLASWAGLCPGSYESGGVRKKAHIGRGNKYLRTALYHAGRAAAHSGSPVFSEFYHRIASRGSKQKAVIATAHKILRVIYRTLESTNKKSYCDGLGLTSQ